MATINVYHDEDNQTYQIYVEVKKSMLSPELNTGGAGKTDVAEEVYLEISTSILKYGGVQFPRFIIRSLSDVAPGAGAATSWTDLINDYVDYFLTAAEMGMSSSSESTESSSSSLDYSESSSSSSSMVYSESSSSDSSDSSESSSSN